MWPSQNRFGYECVASLCFSLCGSQTNSPSATVSLLEMQKCVFLKDSLGFMYPEKLYRHNLSCIIKIFILLVGLKHNKSSILSASMYKQYVLSYWNLTLAPTEINCYY